MKHAKAGRETKSGEIQMFAGLVKCADCGSALTASKSAIQRKVTDKAKREFKAVKKRLTEIEKITSKFYEDNALGRVTDEKYIAMSARLAVPLETPLSFIGQRGF